MRNKKILFGILLALLAIAAIIFAMRMNSSSNEDKKEEFTPLTLGDKDDKKKEDKTDSSTDSKEDKKESGSNDTNSSENNTNESTTSENTEQAQQEGNGENLEPGSYSDGSEFVIVIGEDEDTYGE